MSKTLKMITNKLLISIVVIGLCFTTAMLHNMLVKNYESSTLSKYNIFSSHITMSTGVNQDSMTDVEHKIRVKVEAQKVLINTLKSIPLVNRIPLVKFARPSITLTMYSSGGSVFAGFGVMNLMKKYQEKDNVFFHTRADKFCYSMCFTLLQQGDFRSATPYTVIGTHRASGGDHRALRLIERMMGENVIKKSNYFISNEQWMEFYWNDFFHSPSESEYFGLIDEVEKGE